MLPQGRSCIVMEEIQLALGMGKRVVRVLVGDADEQGASPRTTVLGWVTSFKNGATNLVDQGKSHTLQLGKSGSSSEMQKATPSEPSDRTTTSLSNRSTKSSSVSNWAGWDQADVESRAAKIARQRLARQRFSAQQQRANPGTAAVVVASGGQHALE